MQDIEEKQNQPKYLRTQFSARFHYNRAEKTSCLVWFICLVEVIFTFYSNVICDDAMIIIFAITNLLIVALQFKISWDIQIASATRKYFDYLVFEVQHSRFFNSYEASKINEISLIYEDKHPKLAHLNYQNNGYDKFKGVKDWYTDIPKEDDITRQIIHCQKQNLYWDKKLIAISKYILWFFIIITILLFFVFLQAFSPYENLLKIFMMLPLICKSFHELININESKKLNDIGNDIINSNDSYNIEIILEVQELIDKRRNLQLVTSNFVHKINSVRFHKLFRKLNDKEQ